MTDDTMALRALLEKGSDASVLREMIGFAAERLMQLAMTWCRRWAEAAKVPSA